MNIKAISLSIHDHNTYDGHIHHQERRYKRSWPWPSHDANSDHNYTNKFYKKNFIENKDEILAYTISLGGYRSIRHPNFADDLEFKPKKIWDYKKRDNFYYIDHHQSHATYAYLTSKFEESDILSIDGMGWKSTCYFIDKSGHIIDLSPKLCIGELWNRLSKWVFSADTNNAGKLMGLASYGQFNDEIYFILRLILDDFESHMTNEYIHGPISKFLRKNIMRFYSKDIAATLQQLTIELIQDHVLPLKTSDNLCVAGGVAYNGYMNEMFTKHWTNVHVPPAPGDEGQALGTYMHADYNLNNNIHIPQTYGGMEYDYVGEEKVTIKEVAQAIADGKIIGWYQGRSESGNRALGNRSILADPRNPNIKDIINSTIKMREDFRPFAPSVLEEHYQEYFDTNQPSPYMSRIVPVKSDKIPGVTHIDGTARIQTVNRNQNERFYDLINEFYKITGIPMLLNTSFNCQEPIVETPEDAINTFNRTQLDLLVIHDYILRKVG